MWDRWTELLHTLMRNRLRTLLTAFSVAWGIFVLVILLGLGEGLSNGVAWQFRDDATHSVWIRRGQTSIPWRGHSVGRQIYFDNTDYAAIDALDGVEHLTGRFYLWGEGTISYRDRHGAFSVRAVHPEHVHLENTLVRSGRYLNDLDIEQRRKVTVIGQEVSEFLFQGADPLGEWVDINRIQYRVIGTFEDEGGAGEMRQVYIPITTAQVAYAGGEKIHHLMFTVDPSSTAAEADAVAEQAHVLLSRAHNFSPDDRRAVRVRNNLETWQTIQGVLDVIHLFAMMVGVGTMMAGIVGVSNILLVSINERTSEFGLRKALGATPSAIVWMVLQESVLLTSVSGWMGLVGGIAAIEATARFAPQLDYLRDPSVHIGSALGAITLLIIAGGVAGFVPAWRASRVQPVEALRS